MIQDTLSIYGRRSLEFFLDALDAFVYPQSLGSTLSTINPRKLRLAETQALILRAAKSAHKKPWLYVDWAHHDDLIDALQDEELTSHIYKEQVLISEYDALIPIRPVPTDPTNVEFTVDQHCKWLGLLPKDVLKEISDGAGAIRFFLEDLPPINKNIHIQCGGIEAVKHTANRLLSYVPESSSAHQKLSHIHRQLSEFDTAKEFLLSCAIVPTASEFRDEMFYHLQEAWSDLVILHHVHNYFQEAFTPPHDGETVHDGVTVEVYDYPDWWLPSLDW